MATVKKLANGSLSKTDVDQLIESGAIRESFLSLEEGFNAVFKVSNAPSVELDSFKTGGKFEMPMFILSNDASRYTIWGSTLLGALVMPKEYDIKVKTIEKAGKLPVYFRDEFTKEFTNLRKVSDIRDDDGGITIYDRYEIIGAIVTRSAVDDSRWLLGPKMYLRGNTFIEYERIHHANTKLNWVSETRIHELAKMTKKDRTFAGPNGQVILPSTDELEIIGNADTDPRWAKAQFILKDTSSK